MNYLYDIARRNKQDPEVFAEAVIVMVILTIFSLVMIGGTSKNIHDMLQTPIPASGKLQKVEYGHQESLELHIGEEIYVLRKQSKYSKRSFGLRNNMLLSEMGSILAQNIEREDIELEYVQESGKNLIVQLSIAGTEYVNKEIAVSDFVGLEKTTRWIGVGFFLTDAILLFLLWKGIIK